MIELEQTLEQLRPALRRAYFFSLVSSLLVLAPILYMFAVYGRVVDSQSLWTLFWLTVVVVWSYLVLEFTEWARAETLRADSLSIDRALSSRVFQAMVELNRRNGTLGQVQPMTDLRTLREFLYSPVLMSLFELPTIVVFLAILFAINPWIGLTATLIVVAQTVLAVWTDRRTRPLLVEANRVAIEAQQYVENSLRNALVVESMGMLGRIKKQWGVRQQEMLMLQANASANAAVSQSLTKFFQLSLASGLLGLAAWLLLSGELAGGATMMIVASVLGGKILAPLAQVMSQWRSVVNARDAYARLGRLLDSASKVHRSMPLPPPRGDVEVENLSVVPPGGGEAVIRGVSFRLAPGESLAIIGPSGSGKSSLLRALLGSWPASLGKVRLSGVDVYLWNKDELGPSLGYVPQEIDLFDGTVAENISRFGQLDEEKLGKAVDIAGVSVLIAKLDKGINTRIGSDGELLSRGQQQRIAIARAIYGDPKFVVLDEPNSNLDTEGDAALAALIEKIKSDGVSVILVTHRRELLSVVDKILVLRHGDQLAFGPRDEVLEALRKATEQSRRARGDR